jgi:hypothetical protein
MMAAVHAATNEMRLLLWSPVPLKGIEVHCERAKKEKKVSITENNPMLISFLD